MPEKRLSGYLQDIKSSVILLDAHGTNSIARRIDDAIGQVLNLERQLMSAHLQLDILSKGDDCTELMGATQGFQELYQDNFSVNELQIIKDVTLECVHFYDEAETEHLKLLGKVCLLLGEAVDPRLLKEIKNRSR